MQKAILEERVALSPSGLHTGRTLAQIPSSQYTMHQASPAPTPRTIAPNEAASAVKTTFERTILPLALDIGSSTYQAIKESNSVRTAGKGGMMEQPPISAGAAAKPAQVLAPLSSPVHASAHESVIRKGLRQVDHLFVAIITVIDHLLGLINTLLFLLLAARFVLTFFQLSLGEFSYWVTWLTTPLVAPFGDLLLPVQPSFSTTYTVDVSAIVAFVVYSIGFALIHSLLKLLTKRSYYT